MRHHGEMVHDQDFWSRVRTTLFEIFSNPEIERPGGEVAMGQFQAGVVHLPSEAEPVILMNGQARVVARSRPQTRVEPGTQLTAATLESLGRLEPADLDPNSAWALSTTLPDGSSYLALDFRRDRGKGRRQLELAEQYQATAVVALANAWIEPNLEPAFAATELSITAMKTSSAWHASRKGFLH